MYWLIGGACLFSCLIGWLIGDSRGYKRGKAGGLRELGQAELYDRQRKIRAYRNRGKKPVQGSQNRAKKR